MNANVYNVYKTQIRYSEEHGKHVWEVYCNEEFQCECLTWERAESIIIALQEDDESHGQNQDVEG